MPKHQEEGDHGDRYNFPAPFVPLQMRSSKGASSQAFALSLQVLLTRLGGCLSAIN